jgi:hypothetical protein
MGVETTVLCYIVLLILSSTISYEVRFTVVIIFYHVYSRVVSLFKFFHAFTQISDIFIFTDCL